MVTNEKSSDMMRLDMSFEQESKTETSISDLLICTGITPNLNGYHYLKRIFIHVVNKNLRLHKISDFFKIAEKEFGKSYISIERNIRTCLNNAYIMGQLNNLFIVLNVTNSFGNRYLSPGEFLRFVSERLLLLKHQEIADKEENDFIIKNLDFTSTSL